MFGGLGLGACGVHASFVWVETYKQNVRLHSVELIRLRKFSFRREVEKYFDKGLQNTISKQVFTGKTHKHTDYEQNLK